MKRTINNFLRYFGISIVKWKRFKGSITYIKQREGNKELVGTEIGVYKGCHARKILKYMNIKELYLIDPYKNYLEYNESWIIGNNILEVELYAKENLRKFKNITWIKKFSEEAMNDISMCDFIYVDGNHSYKYVFKDLENYYPKVKVGGYLCGHDIQFKEVMLALQDFCKENNLKFWIIDTDWIIEK